MVVVMTTPDTTTPDTTTIPTSPTSPTTPSRPTSSAPSRPTARTSPPVVDRRLSAQLNRDWERLTRHRTAAAAARRWDLPVATGEGSDDLLGAILDATRRPTGAAEDLLRRLVETAHHDDLAARIVLQRILPGLLTSAQRSRAADRFDDLIGSAWVVIRTFDMARRPSCLAAALIRSAEHHAYKAAARRLGAGEFAIDTATTTPSATLGDCGHDPRLNAPEPILELAEVLSEARDRGLAPSDVEWVTGLVGCASTEEYAERLGVTSRTIRNHRAAVARRIRQAVDSAA